MLVQKSLKKQNSEKTIELLRIPDKLYFTIGEVSRLCDLKPHVLRYWEQEFPQLKPSKRRGSRRYYQHKDIQLVNTIKNLLYERGFTIEGAKIHINDKNKNPSSINHRLFLQSLVTSLEQIVKEIE